MHDKHDRDVFLCHASEDKRDLVYPLMDALSLRAVSCWVDETHVPPGGSIVKAISAGVLNARYFVACITDHFLNSSWTRDELDSALYEETQNKKPIVLPILATGQAQYHSAIPQLSRRRFLDWASDPVALADQIARLFNRAPALEWHHFHPDEPDPVPVWVRVLPQPENLGKQHRIALRWGAYGYFDSFRPQSARPHSYIHHKLLNDGIPVLATVSHPCIITFGRGSAPDPEATDTNARWIRSSGNYVQYGDPAVHYVKADGDLA